MLRLGEDTPYKARNSTTLRYNLRKRKPKAPAPPKQRHKRCPTCKRLFPICDLADHIATHPRDMDVVNHAPRGDNCIGQLDPLEIDSAKRLDPVTTPLVDNPIRQRLKHNNAKPKRELPSTSKKAALRLPPPGSRLWSSFDETVSSALTETVSKLNVRNFE